MPLPRRSRAWRGGQRGTVQRRGRGRDQVQEPLHDRRRAFVGLPGRRDVVEASPQVCVPAEGVNHLQAPSPFYPAPSQPLARPLTFAVL